MSKFQVIRTQSNTGLFTIVVLVYLALLLLFAWQTLLFVNIMFPDSDLMIKVLTVFSVDGMGFVYANLHTFYRFAHPHAKTAIKWGWGITYGLSALLSIFYLSFTYILDFQHITDQTAIKWGVALSIAALMFNLAIVSVFLYYEISTRWRHEDEYEMVEAGNKNSVSIETVKDLLAHLDQETLDRIEAAQEAMKAEHQAFLNRNKNSLPAPSKNGKRP